MLTRIAPLASAPWSGLAGCVSGQVTDAATGRPIAGATITFRDGKRWHGDDGGDGQYNFDGITSPAPRPAVVQGRPDMPRHCYKNVQYDEEAPPGSSDLC
jgi:hypothetical protein